MIVKFVHLYKKQLPIDLIFDDENKSTIVKFVQLDKK